MAGITDKAATSINQRPLAAEQYRSAKLVFGWSFYGQGTRVKALRPQMNFSMRLSLHGGPREDQLELPLSQSKH